jgi:putative Mg2+ transporter-C (MgtC) family protein
MMKSIIDLFETNDLTTSTILIRLLMAFVAGAIIGIEREAHRQPAGLKTHILICVGSTLIMLISISIPQTYASFGNADPGRIAAQVVSGIGFIGAGAILRMGINVRGLTTAASIWSIGAIGLAIGAGMYVPAGISVILILFVLIVVEQLEKHFFTPLSVKLLSINSTSMNSDENIRQLMQKKHFRIIDVNPSYSADKQFQFVYKIGITGRTQWIEITREIIETDKNITEVKFLDPTV